MAARKDVWDLKAPGGPAKIDMFSVDADEAVANDPSRYTFDPPDGTVEAEVAEADRATADERAALLADEERKIREADRAAQDELAKLDEEDAKAKAAANEKKRKEEEKAAAEADVPSSDAKRQQIEERRRQAAETARLEREAAARGETVKGKPLKNGSKASPAPQATRPLTTTDLPGPVPFKGHENLENQTPSPVGAGGPLQDPPENQRKQLPTTEPTGEKL